MAATRQVGNWPHPNARQRQVDDQLLIAVAQRLGAGFAILLDEAKDKGAATRFADKLPVALAAGFNLEGHQLFTTASVGIALGRPGYVDPGELLRDAETAAHNATRRGGGFCRVSRR